MPFGSVSSLLLLVHMTKGGASPCVQWLFIVLGMLILLFQRCYSAAPRTGPVPPVFLGHPMDWIDSGGSCLYSASKTFSLIFINPASDGAFFLSIKHTNSGITVWTANRDIPIANSDMFEFSKDGDASLTLNGKVIWSTQTGGKNVETMELQESGNLVLLNKYGQALWQSFDHPTDTLVSNQSLKVGMNLISNYGDGNFSSGMYTLEMQAGNLVLYADYSPPQLYWAMQEDVRRTILIEGSPVTATLSDRYLGMYDRDRTLLTQFIFSNFPMVPGICVAVLGTQ